MGAYQVAAKRSLTLGLRTPFTTSLTGVLGTGSLPGHVTPPPPASSPCANTSSPDQFQSPSRLHDPVRPAKHFLSRRMDREERHPAAGCICTTRRHGRPPSGRHCQQTTRRWGSEGGFFDKPATTPAASAPTTRVAQLGSIANSHLMGSFLGRPSATQL